MRFAYYIPQLAFNEATDAKLVELGMGDRFCDCFGRLSHEHIAKSQIHARGPDGGAGTWVYASPGGQDPLLWKPDGWESQKSDNGQFYLCWQKGATVEPEKLKRRKLVEGKDVELLDGRVWHCPTIRKQLAVPNVPCSYQRTAGNVKRVVVPAFQSIWEASGKWAAEAFSGHVLTDVFLLDIATTCIAVNYRVGDEELRHLSLFDFDSMLEVVKVAIDFDAVADMLGQKKSQEDSGQQNDPSTSPGGQDSTQGTEFRAAS